MKAIETQYKGYRFRSRLEARWAVFFDALGIDWEYDPEGFELDTGERYLPDFWIPSQKAWIEIKGSQAKDSELSKCRSLFRGMNKGEEATDLLFSGQTDLTWSVMNKLSEFLKSDNRYTKESFNNTMSDAFNQTKNRYKVYLFEGLLDAGWLCLDHSSIELKEPWRVIFFLGRSLKITPKDIGSAAQSARSARFEHGETPC